MSPLTLRLLTPLFLAFPLAAQSPRLGRITFPSSGRTEAQPVFVRGVLFLHSFEYDSAALAFREAQRLDPSYAMAYWGEAMTYNHAVWYQQDSMAARRALGRLAPTPTARRSLAPTVREKRWLDAIEILYGPGNKLHRDTLYAAEMERFAKDFPGDHEVQAFFALSLLGLSSTGRHTPTYMRAASIAEDLFRENPEHPGALHYLIHAYDDPTHAPLGMRAARAYATVAPSAAHAQHMTSHIFVALGMWDDVERANVAAWEASNRRNGHYTQWLAYAYLQQGRLGDAERFLDAIVREASINPTQYLLVHMNRVLAAHIVDAESWTSRWAKYAADSARRVGGPGFRNEGSALDFAAGYAALQRGDQPTARRLRGQIAERNTAARKTAGTAHVAGLDASEVMGTMLDALLLTAEGDTAGGIAAARGAAEREEGIPFEFGPPETVLPPNELWGDLLLAAGRASEARDVYMTSLARAPNRSRTTLRLARAFAALGDTASAGRLYSRFLANCSRAQDRSAAMTEAEAYLAKSGAPRY